MNKLLSFIILWVFISACTGVKNTSTAIGSKMTTKQLFKQMDAANFDFDFLQAKAKVKFDDGEINQSFTALIRIEHNKTIWMSLTGPFGIEGARVLISPDRIQVIDRLNDMYYDEPFDFINNYLPFPADFSFMQNLIVGNVFHLSAIKEKHELVDNAYIIRDAFDGIEAEYEVSPSFRYRKVKMNQQAFERDVKLTFDDYRFVEDELFAMFRQLHFKQAPQDVQLELNFTKVRKETMLDFPFSVPNKMKN